jgi:hypothetical protein
MIAVRMMQPSAHEVIDVITMGHCFVSAGWPMLVRAAGLRRALDRIGGVDRDGVLVDMIFVRVMEVAVVEIIDVPFMADRSVPAVGTMLVGVVEMMLLGAGGHDVSSFFGLRSERDRRLSPFGGIAPWRFPPTVEHARAVFRPTSPELDMSHCNIVLPAKGWRKRSAKWNFGKVMRDMLDAFAVHGD